MERLEGGEKKNMLAPKKTAKKTHSGKLSGLVLMHVGRLQAVHSPCSYSLFLFYQAHSRGDYRHRGITILKLLQPGSDLQPVMES